MLRIACLAGIWLSSSVALAADPVELQITPVEPVLFERRGDVFFADFGKAAYGNLQVEFSEDPPVAQLKVRLGEKLGADGRIDRDPPGSVNFREIELYTQPGTKQYPLDIPSKDAHQGRSVVKMPPEIGEVTPFRYVEIEGAAVKLDKSGLRQLFVHAPFADDAASFESSDETLNAVWDLCRHTVKATSAFGVYIDGERERIAYEADAYINQLSHYGSDLDPRVARYTIEHLLEYPTWPTEWALHMPMMAAADYMATGDLKVAAANYEALKEKLLMEKARDDGLLRVDAIVDWPGAERDNYNREPATARQVGPDVNTVANAFYYHALRQMEVLARALNYEAEADDFDARADQVYDSFHRVFFDTRRGIYRDGEGSTHASLHANMFPLAFNLTPANRRAKVADFVQSRGMACSVYGAQYLLEGLFRAGKDQHAVELMSARTERSWWHMTQQGSTMTLEAWNEKAKSNLTWNHAWGAAPGNILPRFVLGVRPIEPGYAKILIAPRPGALKWVRGKVPTAIGPVVLNVENAAAFKLAVELPPGAKARVVLPHRAQGQVSVNGKDMVASSVGGYFVLDDIGAGKHVFESR